MQQGTVQRGRAYSWRVEAKVLVTLCRCCMVFISAADALFCFVLRKAVLALRNKSLGPGFH